MVAMASRDRNTLMVSDFTKKRGRPRRMARKRMPKLMPAAIIATVRMISAAGLA
jgi:hypothetical protein